MAAHDEFDSKNLLIGETRRKGIVVSCTSGTLNITSAYYTIYDASDNSVITSETAAIINGATVYAMVEAGDSIGQRFLIFKYYDNPHLGKARLNFNIVQG